MLDGRFHRTEECINTWAKRAGRLKDLFARRIHGVESSVERKGMMQQLRCQVTRNNAAKKLEGQSQLLSSGLQMLGQEARIGFERDGEASHETWQFGRRGAV